MEITDGRDEDQNGCCDPKIRIYDLITAMKVHRIHAVAPSRCNTSHDIMVHEVAQDPLVLATVLTAWRVG